MYIRLLQSLKLKSSMILHGDQNLYSLESTAMELPTVHSTLSYRIRIRGKVQCERKRLLLTLKKDGARLDN